MKRAWENLQKNEGAHLKGAEDGALIQISEV